MTIADLVIRLGLKDDASKSLAGTAGKIRTGFSRAALPAAGALGAVTLAAKKAIDSASDMNETVSKTRTVFGPAFSVVEKFGNGSARSLGISKQAALDAASTYGTFGKAAGLTGKALAKFSTPLVKAAADLGSFHNVPVAQALEDIRSGLAGETEPLRKYGILLNDAALRSQALKMGLVSTTKDALSPQNKMLAAQQLILKSLGPAAGDFARTSDSAANRAKIQAAETANLTASLGSGLLPAYKGLQGVLLMVTGIMARHQGIVKVAAMVVAALAVAVLSVNAAFAVYSAGAKIAAVAQRIFNAAVKANTIVLIVAALIAVGAAFVLAYKRCETFRKVVNAVVNFVRDHWRTMVTVMLAVFLPMVLLVIKKWGTFKAIGTAAVNGVKSAVSLLTGAVRGAWSVVGRLIAKIKDLSAGPINVIRGAFNILRGTVSSVLGVVRDVVDAIGWVLSKAGAVAGIVGKIGSVAGKIPGLAAGGIVTRPTLAMVGEGREPEAVIPLSKLAGMVGGGGGGVVVNISGPVYGANAEQLAREIRNQLLRMKRSTGSLGLA